MLVTATAVRAELGLVAGLLQGTDPGKTPLQQRRRGGLSPSRARARRGQHGNHAAGKNQARSQPR